ncbi:hypothetical protein ACKKBF_B08860 [Auxenochlorella protothecoides x Auxenochlorella symbiontica]
MVRVLALLRQAATTGHDWKKDDVLDVMLYLRCLSALIAGITVGCLGLEGLYIFLGFVGFNYTSMRLWMQYQGIESEDFAAPDGSDSANGPVWFEGFAQSLTLFVLSWVISYSVIGSL